MLDTLPEGMRKGRKFLHDFFSYSSLRRLWLANRSLHTPRDWGAVPLRLDDEENVLPSGPMEDECLDDDNTDLSSNNLKRISIFLCTHCGIMYVCNDFAEVMVAPVKREQYYSAIANSWQRIANARAWNDRYWCEDRLSHCTMCQV